MLLTRNLAIALVATVISFSTLYIPQPMLPLLADTFGVSASDAGLLMTLAMLPLAIAPVVYGYFLQAVPAKLMLMVALGLLALNQLCFALATEFWHLLALRLVQGLLLPPTFTVVVARVALAALILLIIMRATGQAMPKTMAVWRAFIVMGLLQLLPLVLLVSVEADADINFARLDRKSVFRVLQNADYRYMFLALASVFFVFSGILNNIPFHLRDLDASTTPLLISMLYLGYLIGAPVSFYSESIGKRLGHERNGLYLGLAVHAFGLVMLLFVAFHGLIVMMFFLAAGFFLIHALLSGLANHLAPEHKGVINGLYVSIYYLSGALGSWLPGYLYEGFGWSGMIGVFFIILALGAWGIGRVKSGLSSQ